MHIQKSNLMDNKLLVNELKHTVKNWFTWPKTILAKYCLSLALHGKLKKV